MDLCKLCFYIQYVVCISCLLWLRQFAKSNSCTCKCIWWIKVILTTHLHTLNYILSYKQTWMLWYWWYWAYRCPCWGPGPRVGCVRGRNTGHRAAQGARSALEDSPSSSLALHWTCTQTSTHIETGRYLSVNHHIYTHRDREIPLSQPSHLHT
jgi:hypothetical protein